jgi:hypothetical protein
MRWGVPEWHLQGPVSGGCVRDGDRKHADIECRGVSDGALKRVATKATTLGHCREAEAAEKSDRKFDGEPRRRWVGGGTSKPPPFKNRSVGHPLAAIGS